jgi:hypothetical protein
MFGSRKQKTHRPSRVVGFVLALAEASRRPPAGRCPPPRSYNNRPVGSSLED